ncbi:uncharacterized protein LOC124173652 [Ischnura elegans]|uniref:uncharacterized protein LOC124173652 n=1 Tax=Ischnura elegans TaxID=197161 RepID=UPI001ED88CEF|nr:uncharacterized protein LOC124173652 [Ischnura elegans]XP_046409017.1 uncharacterized protein LOC124173652 [Ischnura elegans]
MARNGSASVAEEFVEERLLNGFFAGSLVQHKELLDMLEDVDGRVIKERTLLHVGVRLGKSDWVEELLARGADPGITDDRQLNALSSAEDMVRRFPDDVEHLQVLKLVKLVHRRDQVIMHRLESSSGRADHTTPVAGHDQNIDSLKSSVDALRREMKVLLCQLSESLEELKAQVSGPDALLYCLEKAVTSTAEDVTSIKFGLGGEASLSQPTSDPARARQECVDAMMHKTRIVYGDGVDKMHRFYEILYDKDNFTACILRYLSGYDRLKVMVDCDSNTIIRMQEEVVFLDGTQGNGSKWYSFCDFESEIVYLGAKDRSDNSDTYICSGLAWSLSQLSLKLVFDNEGRPYSKGDVEREHEWMRALEEAEERRKRVGGLDWSFNFALNQTTQLAKLCWLAAAVPHIISWLGSTEGRSHLQQHYPLLFSCYTNNAMRALLAKARL